jgi:formamidopyrimidine-DNA glycosylase
VPELPEVQTIVNDLQGIAGYKITGFSTNLPKALKGVSLNKFKKIISEKKIIFVRRIGKNILLVLSEKIGVLIHLKMTGKLLVLNDKNQTSENKHMHHAFFLETTGKKQKILEFHDIRKFGTITFLNQEKIQNLESKFGVDPLEPSFSFVRFSEIISKKPEKKIKELLMDQKIISGIGNIYASEILFEAGILPYRKMKTFKKYELSNIFLAIRKILKKAVRMRGTSVSDYRDASGKSGKFQKYLRVYKRHTQKCQKCDTIIRKLIIGQRSTFYCPNCQK